MIPKMLRISPNKRRKTGESAAKQPMTKVSTKQKKLLARSPKQPARHYSEAAAASSKCIKDA
jgi:hypothetical protein